MLGVLYLSRTIVRDASIDWAVKFIIKFSDGDLFPKVMENEAISAEILKFTTEIQKNSDIPVVGGSRRFIVPKDELSYRQATQLFPQDSIILTALIYQYGQGIEERRVPNDVVYSYRFAPDAEKGLYSANNEYENFRNKALSLCASHGYVLCCDIADFYNQIYHHTLENQLIASGFPNQACKWIIKLLNSTTANVSRGIPVGPHATHLLAEAAMIPIDNSLNEKGIIFLRHVDDILIFADSEVECKRALFEIASTLDKQQRLMLQRHKTRIYNYAEFKEIQDKKLSHQTVLEEESLIYDIVNRYSDGNPYTTISYEDISEEDRVHLSEQVMADIISSYLNQENIDYGGLRWFYKRLAQLGHPGAISFTLHSIDKLVPCFAQICIYFGSVQFKNQNEWKSVGVELLNLFENEYIAQSEYFRLLILSLFSRNSYINHFPLLAKRYNSLEAFGRREIILAAKTNDANDWLRELKETYQAMDIWQKSAFLFSMKAFPKDEKKFFISNISFSTAYETTIADWAKQ